MADADMANLEQGDVRLLDTELARALLGSRIPARCAFVAADGTPRVVSTWFDWDGTSLHMATFLAAPHVTRPVYRVPSLRARPHVAVTIDTENFPPHVLLLRGPVVIDEVDGVAPSYARAAERYLGDDASDYLAGLRHPSTRMADIALVPTWVGLLDFEQRLPEGLGGVTA